MKRNLAFFCYPRSCGMWRRSIAHLLARWEIFTGRKIVTVATDCSCDDHETVRRAFGGAECEFLFRENVPGMQETAHFLEPLKMLENEGGITLRAHAKGSTHENPDAASHLWLDAMATTCLDYPRLIELAMGQAKTCGPFRSVLPFGSSRFHFAGSWYWLDNHSLFSRDWWRIDEVFFGVESYPGVQFSFEESCCLFADQSQTAHLYNPDHWKQSLIPACDSWKNQLAICGEVPLCQNPPNHRLWYESQQHQQPRIAKYKGNCANRTSSQGSADLLASNHGAA